MNESIERVRALAERWEAACRSRDTDRIAAHLAQEAVIWYNFQPGTEHAKADYLARLAASAATLANARYTDLRVHLHPGGFALQATLAGDTPTGALATPFLLVATVAGDKITRIDHYFDTTGVDQAGLA